MPELIVHNEILDDQRFALRGASIIVGRGEDAQIRIPDPSVSRFHARIDAIRPDILTVTDLGSSNGTYLNGDRIESTAQLARGDRLRFGAVTCTVEMAAESREARPGAMPPPKSRRGLWAAGAAILFAAACAAAGYLALFSGNGHAGPADGGRPSGPDTGGSLAPEAPLHSDPEPGEEAPLPDIPPEPEPLEDEEPSGETRKPGLVSLRDGRQLAGTILDPPNPVFLSLRLEDGSLLHIPREEISAIDGTTYQADLAGIFEARFATARNPEHLLDVARWCSRNGLQAEAELAARKVLEEAPGHPEAHALLGRHRYLGKWVPSGELRARGALDAGGRLQGTPADLRDIRRAFFVLVNRPPLETEYESALSVPREEVIAELLASPDHWMAWIEDALLRFLGEEASGILLDSFRDLAADLAADRRDFVAAFHEIAGSDTVRIRYPSPREFAARVLDVFLGPGGSADAERLAAAAAMVAGERTALFGERGASRAEFLRIVSRQPAFFRRQLRYESERIRGEDLERRDLTRFAMQLATDPGRFKEIRREWFASTAAADRAPRRKPDGAFVRGLWMDVTGRLPGEETAILRQAVSALGRPDEMRRIVPALVVKAGYLSRSGLDGDPPAAIARLFRRALGRDPEPQETEAALKTWESLGVERVVIDVLTSNEYQSF